MHQQIVRLWLYEDEFIFFIRIFPSVTHTASALLKEVVEILLLKYKVFYP